MKQLMYGFLFLFVLLGPASARAAGSATMTLDQASVQVQQGDVFEIAVLVNPLGESLDTVRSVLTYDPVRVRAQIATLTGAFDRSSPGNYIDNGVGKISWGGFTLGEPVTGTNTYLSVTFLALEQGEATISVSPDSRLINNGEERINVASLGAAAVAISAAADIDPSRSLLLLESGTHPSSDLWYANAQIDLHWIDLPGESPIETYRYAFDQAPSTIPEKVLGAEVKAMTERVQEDGVYYAHVQGVQADGLLTDVVHYRFQVDTTAPNPIELAAADTQILEGESAWLTFATTDEMSGVAQYQIALNSSEFQPQVSPLEMEDLPEGTYFFRVAAVDRAGNATYGSVNVRVYPQGTDLDRPEGYVLDSEVAAVTRAAVQTTALQQASDDQDSRDWPIVVLVILGLVALVTIFRRYRRT